MSVVVGVGLLFTGSTAFDEPDELHAAPNAPTSNALTSHVAFRRTMRTSISPLGSGQRTLPRMTDPRDVESVERVIPAPPEAIFSLLADPARHHDIDGSGSVNQPKTTSGGRLKLGDQFGMGMKRVVPYSTTNTVIEFEDDRRIAWRTGSTGFMGKVLGGPIWRYELEPADGGTRVRESWDISESRAEKPLLRMGKVRKDTRKSMTQTLENIEKLLTA